MDDNTTVTPEDQPVEPNKDWAGTSVDGHPLNDTMPSDVSIENVDDGTTPPLDDVSEEEKLSPETHNVFEQAGNKSVEEIAKEVLAGKWGTGVERRQALADAGYDPNEIHDETIRIVNDQS